MEAEEAIGVVLRLDEGQPLEVGSVVCARPVFQVRVWEVRVHAATSPEIPPSRVSQSGAGLVTPLPCSAFIGHLPSIVRHQVTPRATDPKVDPDTLLVSRVAVFKRWRGPWPPRWDSARSRASAPTHPGRATCGRPRRGGRLSLSPAGPAASLFLGDRPRRRSPFPFARTRVVKARGPLPSSPGGLR